MEQRSKTLREKMPIFNELCGFNLFEFYKKYSISTGYLRLNRNIKRPFIHNMKNLCDEIGMRFYVSDAHFKEMCHNGSCCGLPENWNYSRGQWCNALMIAKQKGYVTYSDVKEEINKFFNFAWKRAEGYNTNSTELRAKFEGMTMADYMHWLWNSPEAGQSPYKLFEGILKPKDKDENGDLIYYYNNEVS